MGIVLRDKIGARCAGLLAEIEALAPPTGRGLIGKDVGRDAPALRRGEPLDGLGEVDAEYRGVGCELQIGDSRGGGLCCAKRLLLGEMFLGQRQILEPRALLGGGQGDDPFERDRFIEGLGGVHRNGKRERAGQKERARG